MMEGEKPLIQIHHDVSTFYANADQGHYWADDHDAILKQKSLGQAIMVSDFVEEVTGDYCAMMSRKHDCCLRHSKMVTLIVRNFVHKWTLQLISLRKTAFV